MTERRYRENEIREIFELAADRSVGEPRRASDANGLTLADMQDIGLEVGLEPDVVARAAAVIDARGTRARQRTSLGMPIEVGRLVQLPRAPTDAEWEQLVAVLRSTFGARGKLSAQGSLREWSNGNLHACIEPVADGSYRLRMGTLKGDAAAYNGIGAAGVVTAAIALGALLISGGLQVAAIVPAMLGAGGITALIANVVRLPRWAQRREAQMASIASRVGSIIDANAD